MAFVPATDRTELPRGIARVDRRGGQGRTATPGGIDDTGFARSGRTSAHGSNRAPEEGSIDRKLTLDFEALSVNSFATGEAQDARGTVNGHAFGQTLTTCDPYGACNTRNTCTSKLC